MWRFEARYRPQRLPAISASRGLPSSSGTVLLLLLTLLLVSPSRGQDPGSAATEFYGRGVAVSVVVHDPSGQPLSSAAVVKLFRASIPSAQAQTSNGRAELVVTDIGDFTLVVEAAGYASAQKDVSLTANGRAQIDVYLRSLSPNETAVRGRPLLAPKARKAVDQGLQALGSDNLSSAQKHAAEALTLAPGHPDVLYLQGLILLKQRDWEKAQQVLEKAIQVDPSHANAFAALGMALCNAGKYEAAIAPLEKALQLNPGPAWDTRWALGKAYYRQGRYEQALAMSQAALSSSNGKAPEIELLVAQSLTAVGRYEDAAEELRKFLRDHADDRDAATARRWLNGLAANGKIRGN
jgi:Flp pilus assembly protein TadD